MVIRSGPPSSATSIAAPTISSRPSARWRGGGGGWVQIGGLGMLGVYVLKSRLARKHLGGDHEFSPVRRGAGDRVRPVRAARRVRAAGAGVGGHAGALIRVLGSSGARTGAVHVGCRGRVAVATGR